MKHQVRHRNVPSGPDKVKSRGAAMSPLLAVCLLLCCADPCGQTTSTEMLQQSHLPARENLPNVIIISIDTLRPDHLGIHGRERAHTPHIDAMARAGVRFDQATVTLPRTTPALASMITGVQPARHGVREVGMRLRFERRLPHYLKELGYETVGFTASPMADQRQGFQKGFDHFERQRPGRKLTRAVIRYLRKVPRDRPLFLWAHYTEPHFPYSPPKAFKQPRAPRCRSLVQRVRDKRMSRGALYVNSGGAAAAALTDCKHMYDAEIAYTDRLVGRLLTGLRRAGRLRGAHLLFTADHGEHLGEAGLYYEHGPTVHDADLRIPLFWSGPGIRAGHVDTDPVQLEDLVPTLLARLGAAGAGEDFDGVDLSERLAGKRSATAANRIVFAESASALHADMVTFIATGRSGQLTCVHDPPWSLCRTLKGEDRLYDHVRDPKLRRDRSAAQADQIPRLDAIRKRWPPETARELSARTPRFKLVRYPQRQGGYRQALYDLESDPLETSDVSTGHPDQLARLAAALDGWVTTLPDFEAPERSEIDLQALRALGYVQ